MFLIGGVFEVFMILHFVSMLPIQCHPCTLWKSRVVELSRTRNHFYLYFALSIPLVRATDGCLRSFGHLKIPSATTFCTPGTFFASCLQLLVIIISLPSYLMAWVARLLRDPPHRLIHETAATLSPLNSAGSPGVFGLSCKMTCVTYAVITMP